MAKIQIMKLTKELKDQGIDVTNKDIIAFLNSKGVDVSNHMQSIEDSEINLVRERFAPGGAGSSAAAVERKAAEAAAPQQPKAGSLPAGGSASQSAPKPEAKAVAPAKTGDEAKAKPQGDAAKKPPVKKKRPNIIVSSNQFAKNGRPQNGGRQIVHISGGKIEEKPKLKKVFKHVEVTSPDAFKPKKPEEPPVVKEEAAKEPEEVKSVLKTPAPESVESSAPVKKEERKVIGNIYADSLNKNIAAPKSATPKGGNLNGANRNTQGRPFRPAEGAAGRSGGFSQGSGRNYSGGPNNGGGVRGSQRPGARPQGEKGRPGFEGDVVETPNRKNDASRRRQNEERRKKEQNLEKQHEEKNAKKFNPHGFHKPAPVEKKPEEEIKTITLPDKLTIKELADHMKIQPSAIIKKLFMAGNIVTVNSEVTFEEAENIAIEYDIICEHEEQVDVIAELLAEEEDDESTLKKRPPVVCVMGHVDHGKTSLLDRIRKSHVTDKESGGITQAIGAYVVRIDDRKITFLDTPGHEAFTAMRMRGANSTDIAILVVAADDGVMPQTVEAINHAKAAKVNIIVAVNKMDKPNANIERVKQELAEHELIPEDWGGDTVYVPVSAKTGEGIDQLLEMILLSADMLELKANPNRQARGIVIEARLDKGRGPVATMLIQKGTLHVGDCIAVGPCYGKVRAMLDENGKRIKEATPGTPAEILGLNNVPDAGEIFVSPETEKEAKNFAETYIEQHKKELIAETKQKMNLDILFDKIKEGNLKEFNVIIKADVQGSVEAMKQSLEKLSNDEVVVKIIHGGVGAINESDITLASASNAIIIGFNVRPDAMAKQSAESEEVDIRLYKVIYQAIDDVEAAMKGMLAPVYEEKVIGHAEIRQIFKASGIGNISGSYVLDGVVERGCSVRISRDGEQIFEGALASLKRFKDDVKEVKEGYECGLVFEGFDKVQELDQIEFYKMVEV
ncbi:MAG: translation initiation factor IF-2, partial [Lachnospiraceae bacterium]|nr:translation initiation factor IF-2 [Lachnospiraceae bacterium]